MREQKVVVHCDVCKASCAPEKSPRRLQVIFTTEQTEGRASAPYLSDQSVDLCDKCKGILLAGKMLFARGAMGHNEYYFLGEA